MEGETVDEAIARALAELGVPRDQVRVEILRDARRALLGFGGQKARVRIVPREDPGEERTSAPAAGEAPPRWDGAEALRRLLALMEIPAEVDAAASDEPGQTWLKISSQAGGLLIGRRGQTLDALEYLVNRLADRHAPQAHRYLVDVEGYRERRGRELREAALRLAARARQTARPQTMEPLSPRERRVVHLALGAEAAVTTRSVGEGPLRRVVIYPTEPSGGRGSRA
jgi:spoIIIJ-associated protein